MSIIAHQFESRDALFNELYRVFIDAIDQALQRSDTASLLLSGGSTPAPLYQQLSGAAVDWGKLQIALVDERWVATDHSASNERLLRESLLNGPATKANFTGMKNTAASAFDGVDACNLDYDRLPLPHTLCLLGMGPDGHTASLFPRAQGLQSAFASTQHCAAIRAQASAVTGDFVERMTLTPWSILQSERIILLITGADKWAVLQRAEQAEDVTLAPIGFFTRQAKPLEVFWAP